VLLEEEETATRYLTKMRIRRNGDFQGYSISANYATVFTFKARQSAVFLYMELFLFSKRKFPFSKSVVPISKQHLILENSDFILEKEVSILEISCPNLEAETCPK
jgi:hypothetical protein